MWQHKSGSILAQEALFIINENYNEIVSTYMPIYNLVICIMLHIYDIIGSCVL